jgi:hypothetical protein
MIITQRERNITLIDHKPRRAGVRKSERVEFLERCQAAGRNPTTVSKRMTEQDMTLEEALAAPLMERSQIGRIGKKRSEWRKLTAERKG